MAKSVMKRFDVQVVEPTEKTRRSKAAEKMLQRMSERRYSPNNDPAIKRFEERLRTI